MKSNAARLPCLLAGVVCSLAMFGCAPDEAVSDADTAAAANSDAEGEAGVDLSSVDFDGDKVALTSDNTEIQFVGNHTGSDPKPRTCSFGSFSGTLGHAEGELKMVQVAIDMNSIETEFEKLTTHLKAADFFDVKRHADAAFQSTKVTKNDDGTFAVSGDLTLLGQTHPVEFNAEFAAEGPMLKAEFEIDRTKWGMDYDPSKVEPMVEMTVKVGK